MGEGAVVGAMVVVKGTPAMPCPACVEVRRGREGNNGEGKPASHEEQDSLDTRRVCFEGEVERWEREVPRVECRSKVSRLPSMADRGRCEGGGT